MLRRLRELFRGEPSQAETTAHSASLSRPVARISLDGKPTASLLWRFSEKLEVKAESTRDEFARLGIPMAATSGYDTVEQRLAGAIAFSVFDLLHRSFRPVVRGGLNGIMLEGKDAHYIAAFAQYIVLGLRVELEREGMSISQQETDASLSRLLQLGRPIEEAVAFYIRASKVVRAVANTSDPEVVKAAHSATVLGLVYLREIEPDPEGESARQLCSGTAQLAREFYQLASSIA